MDKLLDENNEIIISLLDSLSEIEETVNIQYRISKETGVLNGEIYLTDEELSQALKLSRRTLQVYRTEGKIPYYQLGGKVLYKASEIQQLLDAGYRKPYKKDY